MLVTAALIGTHAIAVSHFHRRDLTRALPTCSPGYWEKPEANAAIFCDGRWMKSGDVGYVNEDGFVQITVHDTRNLGEYEGDLNVDKRLVTDLVKVAESVAS